MGLGGRLRRGEFASGLDPNFFFHSSHSQKWFLCIYNKVIELNNK